jgi:pimeloyl-ACP methyl ester carboxylesterase
MYPAGVAGITARYITVADGVRLRVVESGAADAPAVLLLHGWGASAYTWRFLLPMLALAGYRAIAPDFRGHGLSDKPRTPGAYTRAALVADTVGVLDALDVQRASVVGWSMGGDVALRLALAHADRVDALVLINPAGLARNRLVAIGGLLSPRVLDTIAPAYVPRWIVAAVLGWASGEWNYLGERDIDEYWAPSSDRGYAPALRALLREFDWAPATEAELAEIPVRTLVLLGGSDRIVSGVDQAARELSNARTVVFPGAGHIVHEGRAREVNAEILRFLARR